MFKDPFSFKGRIRRLEYLITIVIYCIVYFSLWFLTRGTTYGVEVFWSMFLISSYIFIAQGTKRCHDIGENGFYQFIPFYFFWLIIEDGIPKKNKYGLNPKGLKGPEETGKIRQNEG